MTSKNAAAGALSGDAVQTPEAQLAAWIVGFEPGSLPERASLVARRVLLAVCGTGVAAAREDGIEALRRWHLARGGAAQARTLVFGDALPATAAAQINGTMCRALDFCDAMAPGPHFGSAVFPAALAAAELAAAESAVRGPSGAEFLAAVALGCEVGARFNLTESQYDGFDPTGVAAVFAATATAARLLRLTERQARHALGLAFNRCGGSFQSNVDGSLGVRLVQGWVAAAGVECAELARAGLTGPTHFIGGVYGYAHLFGRGRLDPASVTAGLGEHWRLEAMMFKPYPSCGATQGLTALVLQAARDLGMETVGSASPVPGTADTTGSMVTAVTRGAAGSGVAAAQVESVTVRLNPYCHRLVGQPFGRGSNPRVDAQFSAQYCAANALVRGSSKLAHFTPEAVADAAVQALIGRVQVIADPALDPRGHTAVDVAVALRDGRRRELSLDIAPGFPGNPLSEAEHQRRFDDCMAYASWPLQGDDARAVREGIHRLAQVDDALALWRPLFACAPRGSRS